MRTTYVQIFNPNLIKLYQRVSSLYFLFLVSMLTPLASVMNLAALDFDRQRDLRPLVTYVYFLV